MDKKLRFSEGTIFGGNKKTKDTIAEFKHGNSFFKTLRDYKERGDHAIDLSTGTTPTSSLNNSLPK